MERDAGNEATGNIQVFGDLPPPSPSEEDSAIEDATPSTSLLYAVSATESTNRHATRMLQGWNIHPADECRRDGPLHAHRARTVLSASPKGRRLAAVCVGRSFEKSKKQLSSSSLSWEIGGEHVGSA
eukprot:5505681-Pleurochrysis_carterae.AAC.1